jgi:hypothetical protein
VKIGLGRSFMPKFLVKGFWPSQCRHGRAAGAGPKVLGVPLARPARPAKRGRLDPVETNSAVEI